MKSRTLITLLFVSILIFIGLTTFFYYQQFGKNGLSSNTESWGQFGDYFGGLLNPLLSIVNLIILTYLSLRLVKDEDDRNKWTLQELARPLAELSYTKNFEFIKISLHNVGLGPMIITELKILDNHGNTFTNFKQILDSLNFMPTQSLKEDQIQIRTFKVMGTHTVVKKEGKVTLFEVRPDLQKSIHIQYLAFVKKELERFQIHISYRDIYQRELEKVIEPISFDV